MVLIKERRISSKHLIDKDSQWPPVHSLVVALGLDDLWCQVLWRAAQGPCSVRHFLGESKVSDDHMALSVQKYVLRLQVSVGDTDGVKVGECADNLRREKQSCGDRKPFSFPEVGEQLSTTNVGEQEVEVATVL